MLATINIGAVPNDGAGDDLRSAFAKVNSAIGMLNGISAAGAGDLVGTLDGIAERIAALSAAQAVIVDLQADLSAARAMIADLQADLSALTQKLSGTF